MKKKILILLITLILGLKFSFASYAQEQPTQLTDFDIAYQNFLTSYDEYQKQHAEYELARAQYIQSQTLAAKAKSQAETYEMLSARDATTIEYLALLRARLVQDNAVEDIQKQILTSKVDTELQWYSDHKSKLSSAATLEDQVSDSNQARDRYNSITQNIYYEVLAQISLAKDKVLRNRQLAIVSDLKNKLNQIRTEGDLNTEFLERSVLEVENRINRSVEKQVDIQKVLSAISKSKTPSKSYSDFQFRLNESIQYLKEANTYLKQIIGQIKNG